MSKIIAGDINCVKRLSVYNIMGIKHYPTGLERGLLAFATSKKKQSQTCTIMQSDQVLIYNSYNNQLLASQSLNIFLELKMFSLYH